MKHFFIYFKVHFTRKIKTKKTKDKNKGNY